MDEQLSKHLSNIVEKIRDILNTPCVNYSTIGNPGYWFVVSFRIKDYQTMHDIYHYIDLIEKEQPMLEMILVSYIKFKMEEYEILEEEK